MPQDRLRSFCLYAGVAVASAASLSMQVAATRIFSLTLWHHYAYLVVGLALLGFGAAGSFLTARGGALLDRDGPLAAVLSRRTRAAAVAVFAAMALTATVRCDSLTLREDPTNIAGLVLITILTTIPFFAIGVVITTALAGFSRGSGPVYAADLLGAGLGAIAAVLLVPALGGPGLVFASGAGVAVGALLFGLCAGPWESIKSALLVVLLAWGTVALGDDEAWITPAAGKEINLYYNLPGVEDPIEHSEWTPTARLDVARPLLMGPGFGGEIGKTGQGTNWNIRGVTQDGAAPTALYEARENLLEQPWLKASNQCAAYAVRGARETDGGRALVIGVGGGIDVLIALANGMTHVTGAEINDGMLDLLREHYKDFTGNIPGRDDVTLVNAEGRAFVANTTETFDVIQLSGVDTYAAVSSGANSVVEAYLYTVEAYGDYLDHLEPGGLVSVSRFVMERPRETLRLAGIAAEALRQREVAEPWRHIFVLRGPEWASVLTCERAFTEAEAQAAVTFAEREGFQVLFDPFAPQENPYDELLRSDEAGRAAFAKNYEFRVEPSTDDKPFFFNYFKWSTLPSLFKGEGKKLDADADAKDYYMSTLPIAHFVMFVTLLVAVVLSFAGILRPLRGVVDAGNVKKGPWLVYFAGLGVAFLFVEIGFLQRLTFFLGHPTYALSVVLSSLLVFSGLGAAVSKKLSGGPFRLVLPVLVAGLVALAGWASAKYLHQWIGNDFNVRVAISLGFVAPVGFLLGMPFPTGLERVRAAAPSLIPWAFAVNAFFTVLASTVATMIAMETGFTTLFYAAAGIYIIAFAALAATPKPRPEPAASGGSEDITDTAPVTG